MIKECFESEFPAYCNFVEYREEIQDYPITKYIFNKSFLELFYINTEEALHQIRLTNNIYPDDYSGIFCKDDYH